MQHVPAAARVHARRGSGTAAAGGTSSGAGTGSGAGARRSSSGINGTSGPNGVGVGVGVGVAVAGSSSRPTSSGIAAAPSSSMSNAGARASMQSTKSSSSRPQSSSTMGTDATPFSTMSSATSASSRARRSSTPRTPPSPRTTGSSSSTSTIHQPSHVQAIHDFDPSIMPSGSSLSHNMYLSFRAGELIRVHGRDPSGWWDGEVPDESNALGVRRGWFPSNYIRELDWEDPRERDSSPRERGDGHRTTASYSEVPRTSASTSYSEARSRHASMMSHASHASHASHTSQHSYASHTSRDRHISSSETPLSPALQTLLQPILQSLSLLQSSIHSHRRAHIQPSAAQVISAIRAALLRMDCLSKESRTLAAHPALSKERRYVLSELSKLVACAKLAGAEPLDDDVDDNAALEATGKAARSVFASVRRFLMHASEAGVTVAPLDDPETPTTPVSPTVSTSTSQTGRMRTRVPSGSGASRLKAASVSDLRGAARRQGGSPPPPLPTGASSSSGAAAKRTSRGSGLGLKSPSAASSGSGRSSPVSFRSRRRASSHVRHARSTSMDLEHMPFDTDSPDFESGTTVDLSQSTSAIPSRAEQHDIFIKQYPNGHAVHEAIAVAEDALLSIVASFIGHIHSHNIDSHPSSHAYLIELTRDTVDRVRDLLTIVEAVGQQAGVLGVRQREVESLKLARTDLYDAASLLVNGAEAIANAPFTEGGEEAYDVEKASLLQVTTTTLRAGTECARVVRRCVPEEGGEPDFDSPDLSMATAANARNPMSPKAGYSGIGLGIRGDASLQSLTRRATSLGQLHRRYQQDGARVSQPPPPRRPAEDDDNEEIVADASADEDTTMKAPPPRRSSRPTSHPPVGPEGLGMVKKAADSRRSTTDVSTLSAAVRSRTTSLSTPTAKRTGHKSPSRSVDLTHDMPVEAESRRSSQRSSTLMSFMSRNSRSSRNSQSTLSSPYPQSQSPTALSDNMQLTPILPDTPHTNGDNELPPLEGLRIFNGLTGPTAPLRTTPAAQRGSPALSGEGSAPGDVRFWVVAHDYDPREVAFNSDGVLVGGTLRVLVEKMTPHDGPPDPNFSEAFWYTFRLFSTPKEVVDAFISRYDLKPPPVVQGLGESELKMWHDRKRVPVQARVYNAIKTWLEVYWHPDSDEIVLETLEKFANETVSTTLPQMAPRLLESVRRRQTPQSATTETGSSTTPTTKQGSFDRLRNSTLTGMLHTPIPTSALPTPVITKTLHAQLMRNPQPSNISITDFDTLELARQLTIMESKLFAAVAPEDLLQTGKKAVPELKALSTLSNQITGWVADNILNEQDAKHRAALLKFYIKLAHKCLGLNNFSTLWAVLAGLNSSTIMRLKKTWDVLSVKYRLLMDQLRGVIDYTKNHAAYRARLREVNGPCLPFLGLILSDVTFTQDGNPNSRPSTLSPELSLINQDKYTKLGRIASDFRRYQTPFDFKELEPVQQFLQRVLAERGSGSLDALYRKSLLLEPRQGSERLSSAVEKPGWLGVGMLDGKGRVGAGRMF